MKFISLTLTNGSQVIINPAQITLLLEWAGNTEVHFTPDEETFWVVKETPEEIMRKINEEN